MYCRYCGQKVEEGSRFCLNCGGKIFTEDNSLNGEKNDVVCIDNLVKVEVKKEETDVNQIKQESFFTISKTYFCTNCGSNLGKGKTCLKCHHKKNNGINNYCSFCGASVENEKCSNSNVKVKQTFIEKLLRFISIVLICFSILGAVVEISDEHYLAAVIMCGIPLLCNIFIISKRQIYKCKALIVSKNIKQVWIYMVYILVIILLIVGIKAPVGKANKLTGNDLVAYNLISEVSYEFKNPSSVRLVSGEVFYDDEDGEWCGWFGLSATNGYGARTVGYYFVGYLDGEIFALDLEDDDFDTSMKYAKTKDQLNVEKINNALEKKWGAS